MSLPLPGRILPAAPQTFRALQHRDFRLLWIGQLVSLTGRWMASVAQGWLILRLTDSAFYLGFVGFCTFLPVLLFALVAGVAADRLPRRRALMWTQGSAMALALLLAALTWLGWVRPWQVAAIAFGVGTAGAFDIPIRQSFLQELVGRQDLPNAIALNSLAFNGARLIGPAIGGFVLAAFGEASVFLINGLTYLIMLAGLAMMREPQGKRRAPGGGWLGEIREGLGWVLATPRARIFLGLVVVSSVFGFPYSVLLPVFARDILDAGSRGLGIMMGATGLGAVTGALYIASRKGVGRAGWVVCRSVILLGAGLVLFSISRDFRLSLALLFLIGFAMLVQLAYSNTALQLMAPGPLRGRIVSLFMLAFLGMAPLGSLLAGAVARQLDTPWAVRIGGSVCLLAGLVSLLRMPAMRRAISSRESPRRSRSDP
jgi:MFS family permease